MVEKKRANVLGDLLSGTGGYTLVRASDPAIERDEIDKDDWERFLETRDVSLLKYIPGTAPAKFHCKRLSLAERRNVGEQPDAKQLERAFQLGVQRIEGYPDLASYTKQAGAAGKIVLVPDRVLEIVSEDDIRHIGQGVLAYSFCSADRLPYAPLLGSCQAAIMAAGLHYRRRRAAPTSDSSSSGDGSGKPEGASPGTSTSSSESGAPTGATATGSPT